MSNEIPTPQDVRERTSNVDTGLLQRAIEQIKTAKSTSITVKVQDAGIEEVNRVGRQLHSRGWTVTPGAVNGARVLVLGVGEPVPISDADKAFNRIEREIAEERLQAPTKPESAQNNPLPVTAQVDGKTPEFVPARDGVVEHTTAAAGSRATSPVPAPVQPTVKK